jgi:predicted DNA-binding transcriptional regulator AlpA
MVLKRYKSRLRDEMLPIVYSERSATDPKSSAQKAPSQPSFLLTPKETASRLKVSTSWLAKARMRGDGPPYVQLGRAIRYSDAGIASWVKSHQRFSTSE